MCAVAALCLLLELEFLCPGLLPLCTDGWGVGGSYFCHGLQEVGMGGAGRAVTEGSSTADLVFGALLDPQGSLAPRLPCIPLLQ